MKVTFFNGSVTTTVVTAPQIISAPLPLAAVQEAARDAALAVVPTTEALQDLVAAMFAGGHANATVTYNVPAGTLTIAATGGGGATLTREQVEDFVGSLIVGQDGISAAYNDTAGTLTLSLAGESFTAADKEKLASLTAYDDTGIKQRVAALEAVEPPAPYDDAPLISQMDALTGRVASLEAAPPVPVITGLRVVDGIFYADRSIGDPLQVTLSGVPDPGTPEATAPGRVPKPTVAISGANATATWTAPADGGSPLTGFVLRLDGDIIAELAGSARSHAFPRPAPGSHVLTVTALNAIGAGLPSEAAEFMEPSGLPRVFISTDLKLDSVEQDDAQSLVHALLCQDKFEIVGIAASPSWPNIQNGDVKFVHAVLDIYHHDYPAIRTAHPTAKTASQLKAISYQGARTTAPSGGWTTPTAASGAIISEAKRAQADGVPLYVLVWGGLADVAQALRDDPTIASGIKLYTIAQQDGHATTYVRNTHSANLMMWLENIKTFNGTFKTPTSGSNIQGWHPVHAAGHGSLGDAFAYYSKFAYGGEGTKMGDSPTVFRFLDGKQDDPTAVSWGGQFIQGARPNHFVDDPAQTMGSDPGAMSIYIHRAAILGDFEARFDIIKDAATLPKKPRAPEITAITGSEIDLYWDYPASGGSKITGYVVRRNGVVVASPGVTQTLKIPGNPGGDHSITLAAVNALGEGPQSDPVPFTIETAPTWNVSPADGGIIVLSSPMPTTPTATAADGAIVIGAAAGEQPPATIPDDYFVQIYQGAGLGSGGGTPPLPPDDYFVQIYQEAKL